MTAAPRSDRRPTPLADTPDALWAGIDGVLTDVDDTLTDDGRLGPEARDALQALDAAGIPVVAITGRPAGWSEPKARAWPVRAIVAENGAVALWRDHGVAPAPDAPLRIEFVQDPATRARNAVLLQQVLVDIERSVPGAVRADDSAGRLTDIAIDHAERHHLDAAAIDAVVARMRGAGMRASVSSIHVNGWYGDHDKWSGARWIVALRLGRDLAAKRERWVYVGDSTNDEAMFAQMPVSVGVANLMDFAARIRTWPAAIASQARGAGFAQVAARILARRAPGAGHR